MLLSCRAINLTFRPYLPAIRRKSFFPFFSLQKKQAIFILSFYSTETSACTIFPLCVKRASRSNHSKVLETRLSLSESVFFTYLYFFATLRSFLCLAESIFLMVTMSYSRVGLERISKANVSNSPSRFVRVPRKNSCENYIDIFIVKFINELTAVKMFL